MISADLLSDVLNLNVLEIGEVTSKVNIWFLYDNKESDSINLYELMYKCKLWAISKKYRLVTSVNYELNGECKIYKNDNVLIKHAIRDTELSAVFDACEWIFKKDEK